MLVDNIAKREPLKLNDILWGLGQAFDHYRFYVSFCKRARDGTYAHC